MNENQFLLQMSNFINAQHHQPGASEASGPTRIRFCAKYQKNQHHDPENLKKPDSDLDPIHQLLALRARSFQALKLALRARFRAQTTSHSSAFGLTLGRWFGHKKCRFSKIILLKMSEPLKFFFLPFSIFLGPDLNVSSKNTSFTAKQNFKKKHCPNRAKFTLLWTPFFLLFSLFFSFFFFSLFFHFLNNSLLPRVIVNKKLF